MHHIRAKRFLVPVIAALLLVSALCGPQAWARSIDAKSVILMNFNSGFVHYEQNADEPIAPASLTKILTMYLVFDAVMQGQVSLSDQVTVSKRAAETGGSSMNLTQGEVVTLKELMTGMAVSSGNDACVAVAEFMAGSEEEFVRWMNAKAQALGMNHSYFANPHGLPDDSQITTARDMMTPAASYIRDYPDALATYHSLNQFPHNGVTRRNSNKLLGVCPGIDGLKTGYVASSRCNIICTGMRNGERVIAVVLGAENSEVRLEETTFIMEAGFRAGPRTRYVANASDLPVAQGEQAASAAPAVSTASHEISPARASSQDTMHVSRTVASSSGPLGPYTIQESSWDSEDKALGRVRELEAQGLTAQVVGVDLGSRGVWHRVLLGSFSSRADAESYLNGIAGRYNLSHAFVLDNS